MMRLNRLVQTDMGNAGARAFGLEQAPLTLEASSKNTAYIVSLVVDEMLGQADRFSRLTTRRRRITRRSFSMRQLAVYTLGSRLLRPVE